MPTEEAAADFVPAASDALLTHSSCMGTTAWAPAAKTDGNGQGGAPRIVGDPAPAAPMAKPWEHSPRLPGHMPGPGFGEA